MGNAGKEGGPGPLLCRDTSLTLGQNRFPLGVGPGGDAVRRVSSLCGSLQSPWVPPTHCGWQGAGDVLPTDPSGPVPGLPHAPRSLPPRSPDFLNGPVGRGFPAPDRLLTAAQQSRALTQSHTLALIAVKTHTRSNRHLSGVSVRSSRSGTVSPLRGRPSTPLRGLLYCFASCIIFKG